MSKNIQMISDERRKEILHILRNPWGKSQDEIRQAELDACREVEYLLDAYQNMRDWAKANGVDTTASPREGDNG